MDGAHSHEPRLQATKHRWITPLKTQHTAAKKEHNALNSALGIQPQKSHANSVPAEEGMLSADKCCAALLNHGVSSQMPFLGEHGQRPKRKNLSLSGSTASKRCTGCSQQGGAQHFSQAPEVRCPLISRGFVASLLRSSLLHCMLASLHPCLVHPGFVASLH